MVVIKRNYRAVKYGAPRGLYAFFINPTNTCVSCCWGEMIRLTKGNVQIQFRIERENCENRIYVSKYIQYFSLSIYILLLQHLSFPFNVLRKIHILKYTFIFPTSFRDISSRFCLLTRKKKKRKIHIPFIETYPLERNESLYFTPP